MTILSRINTHVKKFNRQLQSYNAKLSDFGLAKDGPTGDKSHVSTRIMGTYGYAAPEYLATGKCWVPRNRNIPVIILVVLFS